MANHYQKEGREAGSLPRIDCVTGTLGIKYIKPTPMGVLLTLKARVEGKVERKTRVLCEVYAGETLTAIGDSIFVRVDAGHLVSIAHSYNHFHSYLCPFVASKDDFWWMSVYLGEQGLT